MSADKEAEEIMNYISEGFDYWTALMFKETEDHTRVTVIHLRGGAKGRAYGGGCTIAYMLNKHKEEMLVGYSLCHAKEVWNKAYGTDQALRRMNNGEVCSLRLPKSYYLGDPAKLNVSLLNHEVQNSKRLNEISNSLDLINAQYQANIFMSDLSGVMITQKTRDAVLEHIEDTIKL